jgi:subtilisin family serine protease
MSLVVSVPVCVPGPRRPRRVLSMLLLAALTFAAGAPVAAAQPEGTLRSSKPQVQSSARVAAGTVQIQPTLMKQLAAGKRRDYVIELAERADLSAAAGMEWQARGRYVVEQLRATAERSQAALRRELAKQNLEFQPHWIKNVILVRGGDAASVKAVAAQPGVARIRELPDAQLVRPQPGRKIARKSAKAGVGIADNIAWINADEAWAQGTRGNGVTVGIIDTGAYYTHEALRRQYRGWRGGGVYEHDYNWFFPGEGSREPVSADTHGSHVIGTIAGDDHAADPAERDRIGVAPGAQWIACMGLPVDGNSSFNLLACGEFMLAPTRTDGSDPDPDQRPQVINNSWSEGDCSGQGSSFYSDVVDAWVASGIFPVFAAGNAFSCDLPEPAGLSTISSPASLAAAFAVGSTGNHDGVYATHSLWGPGAQPSAGLPTLPDPRGYPQMKPQVVAPGVDIVSVYDGDIDHYGTMTGTSMSSPHISGVVALMLEAGECLRGDYATLGTLLMSTARPLPYASGGTPAPGPGNVPNYATGWGEIDAAAAVDAAAAACGPQGFVAGRISDGNGAPIAGARVELFVDENVRVWELNTETDGSYIRRLPENTDAGYQVRVTAYGYLPATHTGLEVRDGDTTPLDVQLDIAPLATVSGRITDATTGWPLHARLTIAGYPDGPVWTDAVTGNYAVQLPTAASYRVDVDSDVDGYLPQTRQVAVTGALTEDFALLADATTCAAPGYAYAQQVLTEDFESGSPPAGWSMSSAGIGWRFGTHAELDTPNYWPIPPRAGRFAANIDPFTETGNDARTDYLVSPPIDLTAATHPVVRFASRYWNGGYHYGGAHVQVSTDDGVTWSPVGSPPQSEPAWTDEAMSLAAYAGQTVQLRFHYDDGSTADEDLITPGWTIDDVAVVAGCRAPTTGSLVVGHVRDANTDAGLDGAIVSVGGESVVSASSADADIGAGFFAIWADTGSATLTATRGTQPEGYGDAQQTLTVASGETLSTTLGLPAGLLEFDPAAGPAATLELGTTEDVPFTLRNTGTLPLDYGLQGVTIEEHFDGSFPPAGWSTTDNGQGCPWAISPLGNSAGGDGDAAGIYLFDCFETGGGRLDNSLLLPPIDLSDSQTASIGFFLSLSVGANSDPRFDVEVSNDAGTTWTPVYTRTQDAGWPGPLLVEVELSDYAGDADVRIRMRLQATPPWGSLQVDQIHVFRQLGVDDPLAIAPPIGSLAAGASLNATARFDATAIAQPGTYPVPIRVAEDTPYTYPFGDLAGSMTVTAPPTWGSIAGTVRTLGRCEAQPQTFVDLPVRIVAANGDEIVTRTDVDGHFRYWLDAARGPFTVHVAADAHQAMQREAAVTAGAETTADLDLRPMAACVVPDPAAIEVTLSAGETASQPFDLINLGPLDGAYTARAGGDPEVPTALRLSQNLDSGAEAFASFGCGHPATGYNLSNHWLRVFPLAERGLAGQTAWIDGVRFGADSATSAAGSQLVDVTVHSLQGPLLRANLTPLATKSVRVKDTPLGMIEMTFDAPVEVPLDATLVVDISVPDGAATASTFYPAGNSGEDSATAWHYAEDCGFSEPVAYDDIGFEMVSPIIDLHLRASDACGTGATPVAWLDVAPAAGNVPADGDIGLQAEFDASSTATGHHLGAICIAVPGPKDADTLIPVRMNVDAPAGIEIFASGFE